MPLRKTCSTCKACQPWHAFGRDASERDGLNRQCRACLAEYRAEHRDHINRAAALRRQRRSEFARALARMASTETTKEQRTQNR